MPRLCSSLLLSLGIASSASAVTIDWTFVGNPGNVADSTGYGSVAYVYQISTYEVTNSQYVEFLNAVADTDTYALYNVNMGSVLNNGGITRSGNSGSYSYSAIAGRGDMPVNYVSFYDALRFVNWLNNGQGGGNTETGAYTLLGGTSNPSNGTTVTRNPEAAIVLTSQNEWYKAAYYDAQSAIYFDYPAGSNTQTTCVMPTATANRANCNNAVGDLTDVGSYTGSASPYGTFDQGGNVFEWNEDIISTGYRRVRGGSYLDDAAALAVSNGFGPWTEDQPSIERVYCGFRVATIPEPGTGLLVITGLLGLAGSRRARAREGAVRGGVPHEGGLYRPDLG